MTSVVNDDYSYLKLDPERPVLFLDLCGVLNNCMTTEFDWYRDNVDCMWYGHDHVHTHKAQALFSLLRKYRVQVVFVTSWVGCYLGRNHSEILALSAFFDYPDIVGSVNTGGGTSRGRSVLECVRWHGLTHWLILDDSDIMYDLGALGPNRLFSPHGRYGLTDAMLERIEWDALSDRPEDAFVRP